MRLHVVASPETAFLVNSFILEGARSLVVIDTQFLTSAATMLRARIDALGKPLAAVLISHPHPDHFNGTATLLRGLDAPVLATRRTLDGIAAVDAEKRSYRTPIYGDDYPAEGRWPDSVIEPGATLRFDDISLVVEEIGAGESANGCIVQLPDSGALIASDLVYNACHPWLAEGRSAEWLRQLAAVGARYAGASAIHPGHGVAGGIDLLDRQRDYIETFRGLVAAALAAGREVSPEASDAIVAKMTQRFPGYALQGLVALNVAGLAAELEGATAA